MWLAQKLRWKVNSELNSPPPQLISSELLLCKKRPFPFGWSSRLKLRWTLQLVLRLSAFLLRLSERNDNTEENRTITMTIKPRRRKLLLKISHFFSVRIFAFFSRVFQLCCTFHIFCDAWMCCVLFGVHIDFTACLGLFAPMRFVHFHAFCVAIWAHLCEKIWQSKVPLLHTPRRCFMILDFHPLL